MQVPLLTAEVELAAERAAHLGDGLHRPVRLEFRELLGELRQAVEHFQVLVHLGFDACMLHLHHDALACLQACAVDLPDRSRGNGRQLKFGE